MIITNEGVGFIKIQQGDTTIALNPISKESKHKGSAFGADVALISIDHPDCNGIETVTRSNKEAFKINGPGEYEINGMFFKGYMTKSEYGGSERVNTIYVFEVDGIRIAYFGALSDKEIDPKIKEDLGDIDIVFVPIGGEGVMNPDEAYSFAVKREPKVIIPIFYGEVGQKDALKIFLKEGGSEDTKKVDKITLKRKEVDMMDGEIVVLR